MQIRELKHKIFITTISTLFSIFIIVLTLINNNQNYCKAENEKLYDAIKTIVKEPVVLPDNVTVSYKEYLIGVLAQEMPPEYDNEQNLKNEQALKAQMLAINTYYLYHKVNDKLNNKKNITPITSDFQVYINKEQREKKFGKKKFETFEKTCEKITNDMYDKVVTYTKKNKNGSRIEKLANTVYFARSGPKTEDAKNVWGNDIPYLKAVDNSFENSEKIDIIKNYDDAFNLVKTKNSNAIKPKQIEEAIKIESKTDSDRVKSATVFGIKMSGNEVKQIFQLPSTEFDVKFENNTKIDKKEDKKENKENTKKEDNNQTSSKIIFTCKGHGHGVGMSQKGANVLEKKGNKYDQIIKHYYSGVEIKTIEELKNKNSEK